MPTILALTGLVALRVARCDGRAWAAPLAGAAVWCLAGTYAIMTRTPPWAWFLGVLGLVVGLAVFYRRELAFAAPDLGIYALTYFFTLGVMVVIPYPGMWLTGADWFPPFRAVQAVWTRAPDAVPFAGNPSFAAGSLVGLPSQPALAADQIYMAATAAAAMLVLVAGAKTRAALARRRWAIACVALSAFYLVHVQSLGPQWLAAGFFVAAILEALRHRESRAISPALLAIFWFSLGVAMHGSTLLAVPFLCVAFGRPALAVLLRQRAVWAAGLAIVSIAVLGWQVSSLMKFAWGAPIAQCMSPMWHDVRLLPEKIAMNAVSLAVGMLPIELWHGWRNGSGAVPVTVEQVCGIVIALNTWMAMTLLTIFGPTLWVLRAEVAALWRTAARAGDLHAWGAAFALTLLFNCLFARLPAGDRLDQAGLTPVCLLGFVPLVLRVLDHAPSVRLRRIARWHVLTGFGPFVVLALCVLIAAHLPAARWAPLPGAQHDLLALRQSGLESLAETFFPGGIAVFAITVAAFWSGAVRVSGRNVRARRAERTD